MQHTKNNNQFSYAV